MDTQPEARVIFGDSRQLESLLSPASVDLIISGPPYWDEIVYSQDEGQLSAIKDYQAFLDGLEQVWHAASHVLRPGGLMCLWLHDFFRREHGDEVLVPFHADIIAQMSPSLRLRCLRMWDRYLHKLRAKPLETEGPISTRFQYILIFQKEGQHTNHEQIEAHLNRYYWQPIWQHKTIPQLLGSHRLFRLAFQLGRLIPDRLMQRFKPTRFMRDTYTFQNYASECPPDIARQLISDFSQSGDTILDPFLGSGTSLKAAVELGRQCIGVEINRDAWPTIQEKNKNIVIHNNL